MATTETPIADVAQGPKPALVESASQPRARKLNAEERIQQLLHERKGDRERISKLEWQLAEKQNCDAELARLRAAEAEREAQLKAIPERIQQALAEGRSHFADYDQVVSDVQMDQVAFKALLGSTSGWFFMYCAGLGVRVVHNSVQAAEQAKAEARRVEYYRQQNAKHFAQREGA